MTIRALAVVAITLIPLTAQAHGRTELDEWVEQWEEEFHGELITDRGIRVSPEVLTLLEEFQETIHSHPWYLNPPARRSSPTPSPPAVSGVSVEPGVEQWRGLVAAHFPADQVDRALCVMWHESRGDPNAKNPTSTARGLMQILASLWAPHFGLAYDDLYDPDTNMRVARQVWDMQGWWAWSPYKRGLCR